MNQFGRKIQFVNVYETDRAYGGPEEGGWYYDVGVVVKTIPVLRDKANRLLEKVEAWCERRNVEDRRRPGWSVASTGDYLRAYLEENAGQDFPKERPRYDY